MNGCLSLQVPGGFSNKPPKFRPSQRRELLIDENICAAEGTLMQPKSVVHDVEAPFFAGRCFWLEVLQ